jgi:hypothetical protein
MSGSTNAPPKQAGAAPLVGLSLVLLGLALNRWSLGGFLAPDGEIQGTRNLVVIGLFEALLVGSGLLLLLRGPALRRSAATLGLAGLFLVGAAVAGVETVVSYRALAASNAKIALLTEINRTEDLIQGVSARLGSDWSWSARNLVFPDAHARALFAEEVEHDDLAAAPADLAEDAPWDGPVRVRDWEVDAELRTTPSADLELWRPLFDAVESFEHAKFYVVRGAFEEEDVFVSDMGFSAVARLTTGTWASVSGKLEVTWTDHTPDDAEEETWLVSGWHTKALSTTEARAPLFEEVLDRLVPDAADRERARRSIHDELVVERALSEDWEAPPWFTRESHDRHPGVAVVDLDRDGWDDLYVMARWGKNLFFHNRGGRELVERAAELGLDVEGHCAAAVFCDLDNDGDSDLVLGRTLERSMILENVDGRFRDRSAELSDVPLPYNVSSVAAVDVDADGLLDVYFSTYAARMIHQEMGKGSGHDPTGGSLAKSDGRFLADFLPDGQARELFERYQSAGHAILDRPGPPNVLLRNAGGRLAAAPGTDPTGALEIWRNTYQSTWADYDGDGDLDVYAANDFAPNNLVRNDGEAGFVDVTVETDTADVGFGMGAAFGDYNNDGTQDLYVTNMFSKAGRRITSMIAELDPQYAAFARGNSLLRLEDGRFTKVSGLEAPALTVEKAGWSWGGQFLDADNDGFLDLYALSGYFTAPKEIAIPVDT